MTRENPVYLRISAVAGLVGLVYALRLLTPHLVSGLPLEIDLGGHLLRVSTAERGMSASQEGYCVVEPSRVPWFESLKIVRVAGPPGARCPYARAGDRVGGWLTVSRTGTAWTPPASWP